MEEAPAVRRAALEAVRDVDPEDLRADIEGFIAGGSVAPGVLTLLCAGAGTEYQVSADGDLDGLDGLVERAAGVQLIYDGLRLTRELAHTEPWASGAVASGEQEPGEAPDQGGGSRGGDGQAPAGNEEAANIDVLAADVLVARGFYLLARTDAAETAVEVVRSFGRDQTRRRSASDGDVDGDVAVDVDGDVAVDVDGDVDVDVDVDTLDRNLETDVLELAAVAGTTAVGRDPDGLREFAADLAATCDGSFPDPETLFSETVTERLAGFAADGGRTLNRND